MVTTVMSDWRAPAAQVEIDLAKVPAAIPRVAGQVNELVPPMHDVAMPVPGSAWSVGDTAAHLVVVFRGFTDAMEGRLEYWDARYGEGDIRTWARLEGNARTLREVAERDNPRALARQVREGVQRRPRRFAGEAGVVGANLAITLAFALFAVIQLTRTTLAAQQIDDRVEIITSDVGEIDDELVNVAKLDETGRITKEILTAVRPLSGQADEILTAARSIDGTVSAILGNATSIGATVNGISGNLRALAPVVRSINDGVATTNGQIDQVIALVRALKIDLDNVLAEVGGGGTGGHTGPAGKTISGHANSINCSTAVALTSPSGACER